MRKTARASFSTLWVLPAIAATRIPHERPECDTPDLRRSHGAAVLARIVRAGPGRWLARLGHAGPRLYRLRRRHRRHRARPCASGTAKGIARAGREALAYR